MENPDYSPHYFDTRIAVLDAGGRELQTNVYRRVGGDGDDWMKSVQRKTIVTFKESADYWLQVRDLTNQRGGEHYVYRILIRPSVPHLGKSTAKTFGIVGTENEEDRINIAPGETRRLEIVSELEEGFDGAVAIDVENLPPGVRALPGSAIQEVGYLASEPGQVYEQRGAINTHDYLPVRLRTTVVLVAAKDTSPSSSPRFVRLTARPILKGHAGEAVPFQRLALMVVRKDGAPAPLNVATVAGQPKE